MPDPWFDTHIHLDMYPAEEQPAVLQRAAANGVGAILAIGDGPAGEAEAPHVYRAAGVHPKRAAEFVDEDVRRRVARDAVEDGRRNQAVVAIGETGFDRAGPEIDVQDVAFRAQVALARELDLAVVLHVDDEWERVCGRLRVLHGARVVRHYFTGSREQAEWHADRGHYLSFGRPLLKLQHLETIAAAYPAGLLLIETDSYPLPGRTTEPRDIDSVGEALARARGWSVEECRRRLWTNSRRAFRI